MILSVLMFLTACGNSQDRDAVYKEAYIDGVLVEGVRSKLEGTSEGGQRYEGRFDKDTGRIIEGKIIFPNGRVHEGSYDKDTGLLVEGKKTTPDGQVYEGKWDKDTGKQTHRTETLSDGAVIKGIIDEGGTIKEGTYLYVNGNKYTGTLKNNLPHGRGTINYYSGTSWSGGFINGKPIILNTTDNIYTVSPDDQKMIKSIQISTENKISRSDSSALETYQYINASNALCNSPEFGPVDKLREDWVGEVEDLSMENSGKMRVVIRINDIGNKVVDFSLDEKLIDSTVYLLEEEGWWDVTAGDAVVFSGYLEPGDKSENECINSTNRYKKPSLSKTTFTFTFTDIKKL